MIFIEGIDGSGKTSLANTLSEHFSLPIWVRTRPMNEQEFIRQVFQTQGIVDEQGKPIIFDRHPVISELVYGKEVRGNYICDSDWLRRGINSLRASRDLLIYCRPPIPVIRNNIQGSSQMDGVATKWWDILIRYETLINKIHPQYFARYDYTKADADNRIIKFLELYLEVVRGENTTWELL